MDAKWMVDNAKQKVSPFENDKAKNAVDSTCNSCENKPHGLPYRRFDAAGEVIDTINPNKPK